MRKGLECWTVFLILMVLWLVRVVSSYTLGGFIHPLLIVALAIIRSASFRGDDWSRRSRRVWLGKFHLRNVESKRWIYMTTNELVAKGNL